MDRGSSKHGPRLDEAMATETRGLTQGSPSSPRVEPWRDPEPAGEDQPDTGVLTRPELTANSQGPAEPTPQEREGLAELGRHLRRSVFPADATTLVEEAATNNAAEELIAALGQLPAGREYETVLQVWNALHEGPAESGHQSS